MVLASDPQGKKLNAAAKRLGLGETMNDPFQPLVMAWPGQQKADIAGLELEVIAPAKEAVENLRKAWIKKRDDSILADYDDDSPYNLSSIVVVARFAGKSMLLTGDALGSAVLDGLQEKGLLDANGKAHFDLLKLPHHGSQNNVVLDFFQRVTADTYVVSGDKVKFPNPHENAMGWIKQARGDDDYVVYCTYDLPHMHEIFGDRLRVPAAAETSISAVLD
jgi:hypothetical protein